MVWGRTRRDQAHGAAPPPGADRRRGAPGCSLLPHRRTPSTTEYGGNEYGALPVNCRFRLRHSTSRSAVGRCFRLSACPEGVFYVGQQIVGVLDAQCDARETLGERVAPARAAIDRGVDAPETGGRD